MEIPANPLWILTKLLDAGYAAYVVGGCVRDALLGIVPNDWDICTAASPDEIKAVFAGCKTIDVGIRHGTVAIALDNIPYEVTTFRTDGTYADHRRPDSVRFVTDVKEDLLRRDFTVNAMAYNPTVGLVDICGGQADLKNKVLRTVGNADKRFGEDALRMMRCLRFAATYGFEIHRETASAVVRGKDALANIAVERLNMEFSKLLCGMGAGGILAAYKQVLLVFLPELGAVCHSVYRDCTDLIANTPAILPMRLAVLFSFLPQEQLVGLLKRLKYSNRVTQDTVQYHGFTKPLPVTRTGVKLLLWEMGVDALERVLVLKQLSGENVDYVKQVLNQVKKNGECFTIQDLALDGGTLAAMGYRGKEISGTLQALLLLVIEEKAENTRECLIRQLDLL